MKRIIVFVIGVILAGALAYFTAYHVYTSKNHTADILTPVTLQRAAPPAKEAEKEPQIYYLAKIEDGILCIYRMPEESLYDSIKLSSLHMTSKERGELMQGVVFESLTEVFEFLENSMS